eukprot:3227775-Rhodomonas_salina.3
MARDILLRGVPTRPLCVILTERMGLPGRYVREPRHHPHRLLRSGCPPPAPYAPATRCPLGATIGD